DLLAGGNVTLLGSYQVHSGGNVTVTGVDFSLLGYGKLINPNPATPGLTPTLDAARTTAPDGTVTVGGGVQDANPFGQDLVAGGTLTLANTGVITVSAGTSTGSSANPMGNGAKLQGATVNIGSAGTPGSNPTQIVV